MKLWRWSDELGRYIPLSDAEIRNSIEPLIVVTPPPSITGYIKEQFNEYRGARGDMPPWAYYGLLTPWAIFGLTVSMTMTITAIVLTGWMLWDIAVYLVQRITGVFS